MDEKALESLLATNFSDEEIQKDLDTLQSNSGTVDKPSSDDFNFEEFEYGESAEVKPFLFPFAELKIFDQSEDPRTRTACSIYSPRLANNGQNICERKNLGLPPYEQKDPKFDRLDYRKLGNLYVGGSIQQALNYLIKVKAIEGWSQCKTVSAVDSALANGKMILTGSNFGDRGTVFKTKKYSERKTKLGHCFAIVGKVGALYVCLHGYKTCPFFTATVEDLAKMFSKNAMLDKSDADKLAWFKARVSAMKIAPLNHDFRPNTTPKIQGMLAELNKELKKEYNFS